MNMWLFRLDGTSNSPIMSSFFSQGNTCKDISYWNIIPCGLLHGIIVFLRGYPSITTHGVMSEDLIFTTLVICSHWKVFPRSKHL